MYLRGLDLESLSVDSREEQEEAEALGLSVSAICISTHLTAFAVTDQTGPVAAVEAKVRGLRRRT
jgi:hypothetical protein